MSRVQRASDSAEEPTWAGQPVSVSTAFCTRDRPPLVCAHGGDTTQNPPNTLAAFRAGVEAGADCVEIDVARTSDGVLVVLHVRELEVLWAAAGGARSGTTGMQVGDLTWREVQRLRWPSGHTVVRVEDAVRSTAGYVSTVILDVKPYSDRRGQPVDEVELTDSVLRLVHDTACGNCLVWAKSDQVVAQVLSHSPGQRTGVVVMNGTAANRAAGQDNPYRLPGARVVAAHHSLAHPEFVSAVQLAGRHVFVWTVNQVMHASRVLDSGVDGVVTNVPGAVRELIDAKFAACHAPQRGPMAGRRRG